MRFLKSLVKMAPSLTLFNILIATFASALAWSVWFTDKSTNVTGVVEPKGNVISLQNRFDSKIKEVIVDAGDKVLARQILFVLDPEQDAGGLKEKTLEAQSLSIQKTPL